MSDKTRDVLLKKMQQGVPLEKPRDISPQKGAATKAPSLPPKSFARPLAQPIPALPAKMPPAMPRLKTTLQPISRSEAVGERVGASVGRAVGRSVNNVAKGIKGGLKVAAKASLAPVKMVGKAAKFAGSLPTEMDGLRAESKAKEKSARDLQSITQKLVQRKAAKKDAEDLKRAKSLDTTKIR